jgi:hypothetical protein
VHHVALLGDSIFDNSAYTSGQPAVIEHLQGILPEGWRATLLAIDGSTTADLEDQLGKLPPDVTDAVVSIGGNDALLNSDILDLPVSSTREALHLFGSRAMRFEADYRIALQGVLGRIPRVTVCTIYNGNLGANEAPLARVALMLFNDAILRMAFANVFGVIDLRLVCSETSDYANPIEPSGSGGRKIAEAIANAVGASSGTVARSGVYVR